MVSPERRDATQPTDSLLQEAIRGQRTAAGRLVERLERYLRTCVRNYLGEKRFPSEGEDLLQTIRLAIVRGLPQVRASDRTSFKAWPGFPRRVPW